MEASSRGRSRGCLHPRCAVTFLEDRRLDNLRGGGGGRREWHGHALPSWASFSLRSQNGCLPLLPMYAGLLTTTPAASLEESLSQKQLSLLASDQADSPRKFLAAIAETMRLLN